MDGKSLHDPGMNCYVYFMHENQTSVNDWIEKSFPGASLKRKLKHAFEEMTELAVGVPSGLALQEILDVVMHAWNKSQHASQQPDDEIADLRIALTGIASTLGIDEQAALDTKMAANRVKSVADRQAKEALKLALPVYQP